jgi:hypothetical protein
MTTGQDLLYLTLKFGGSAASTSDDYADQAKAAIRQNYFDILQMDPWLFALNDKPGVIVTTASQAGTVSSISGATVTLAAVIATTVADQKFMMDGQQAMYRILTHTAGTATLVLDAEYVETPTSGPATIFQDEYSLSSTCMVLWGPLSLRGNYEDEIEVIGQQQFKAKYGAGVTSTNAPPDVATQIRFDASGNQRIQLAPWPNSRVVLEYDYTKFANLDFTGSGAGDTPLLPLQNRWVIAERSLWTLWRNKNNDLADSAWKRAEEHLNVMRDRYLPRNSRPRAWMRFRNNLGVG